MRTLIVGTGLIGITYGWALSLAGIDVTHLVRSGRKQMVPESIPLDVIDERKGYTRKQVTQYIPGCMENIHPDDNYELVILPLGIDKIEAALPMLVAAAPQALYLTFGTNWRGTQGINKYLSTDQYILGFPQAGGTIQAGKAISWLGRKVYLEEAKGKREDAFSRLKGYFSRAGLQTTAYSNFEHFLWVNHATIMPYVPAMAKAGSISALINDRNLLTQCYRAVREIFELCRLRGANPGQFPEQSLFYRLPRWLFIPGTRWLLSSNESLSRPIVNFASKSAEQELKALYWAIMNTASELGHELPTLKILGDSWIKKPDRKSTRLNSSHVP
jgi:2-dehydropantoate 2-reductase